jgi:hypothetical protein
MVLVISALLCAGCTQQQPIAVKTPVPTTAVQVTVPVSVAKPSETVPVGASSTTVPATTAAATTRPTTNVTTVPTATFATTLPPTTINHEDYSPDSSEPAPTPTPTLSPTPTISPTATLTTIPTTSPVPNGTWKFVVFGDTRDAPNTTTGISPYLNTISKGIAAEKPDLVLFGGDLINGVVVFPPSNITGKFSVQFQNWMDAVSPIYNYTTQTGIPLYVVRGNHEDGAGGNVAIPSLLAAYRASVAAGMPTNGPQEEEHLTYSVTHKGAKFIALDEYYPHDGVKETVNQTWLDEQLTNDTRPFMFVVGHSPAYNVTNIMDEYNESIAVHPQDRDLFWNSLVQNHVVAYFCGHVHTYVRTESRGVQQVLVGNCGAPADSFHPAEVDPLTPLEYPKHDVNASDQKFGYLLVTVHEDAGTYDGVEKLLNLTTGQWETGDIFSFPIR